MLMLPHPVAVAPDVDDVAMVQQPVDERRRHDLVAEHVSPFLESLVRGQHRRRPLVPGVDQLEEEHGAVLADRQVADLVDDEQRGMRQHAQPPGQLTRGPGVHERVDQACQRPVVDASAGLGGRDRQTDRQMRLAHSRRAEQDDVLGAVEESQLVQALDLLALDARLEGKVKLRQRLDGRQARGAHGGLQATVVAQRDLGVEHQLDRFARRHRPAVDRRQHVVDGFQGAGHLQVRQHRPQPVAPVTRGRRHPAASA